MKKFYFLFLFALIASISNLYAAEKTVTFDFSTDPGAVSGIKNGEITVSFDKSAGTTPPKWYAKNGGEMRAYAKNTITVSSVKKIKKIEFSFNKGEDKNEITSTPTGFTSPTWTGKSESVVFKIGGKSGHRKVKTIEVTYDAPVETKCATPTFNLENGKTYTDAQTLEITSTTADATIHYTVNGGEEKIGQPAEFTENGKYTVDAWATKDGLTDSEHASITFTIAKKCATPTFNLTADATYTDAQDLVITSTTEGAQIEYKIEGDKLTAPITGKQASPATVHLTANDTYMVTATATKEGLDASESAVLMFTIAKKMNKPTFNLTEGAVYGEAKVLEITSDKEGAQIEYTIVGGGNINITKTEASPVNVTLDQNGEYTVEASVLEMDDYAKSDAAGLNFKIELVAGVPTFSVEEGTYTEAQAITLSPGEGGSQVFYTINDGTEQLFIEPIKLEEDGTYKITAYTAGTETLAKSVTVTKTYVINLPLEEPYILCEDAAWLTDGAKVIFVGEKADKYYGLSDVDGKFITGGLVTISEKNLTEKDATVKVFVVGRTANGVTFNTDEGYLAADKTASKGNLSYAVGNEGDCFHWTVSVANGEATVGNVDVTGDYTNLQFNTSATNPRFGAYKKGLSTGNLSIYLLGSTSSVSSMSAEGVKVFAAEGGVEVVADEAADVAVYTVAGQLVRQARVAEGSTLVNVAPGFYVVRANGTATKVIVR